MGSLGNAGMTPFATASDGKTWFAYLKAVGKYNTHEIRSTKTF